MNFLVVEFISVLILFQVVEFLNEYFCLTDYKLTICIKYQIYVSSLKACREDLLRKNETIKEKGYSGK